MPPKILVTGGAGYIGAHIVWQLLAADYAVVVVDNLARGRRQAVPTAAEFAEGDVGDAGLLKNLMRAHNFAGVIHCAADAVVPESVVRPLKYYRNNVAGTLQLLAACMEFKVRQFVFSSSAAVYGIPACSPVDETAACAPINPYGRGKLMGEWMLQDFAAANAEFNFVALRYFNVAGARTDGKLGQTSPQATHLIKVACEVAVGRRDKLIIYGDDYPTPDGTCVRDYIHVEDLAAAHINALNYLADGGESITLNCGYGRGVSVYEAVECVKQVSGQDFAVEIAGRRAGDPPALVADASAIGKRLNWRPKLNDLRTICETAYRWEQSLPPAASQRGR